MKHINKLTSLAIAAALVLSGCAENKPDPAAQSTGSKTSVTEMSAGSNYAEKKILIQTFGDEGYSLTEDIPFEGELKDAFDGGITMNAKNRFGTSFGAEIQSTYDVDIYERLKAMRESSETQTVQDMKDGLLTVDVKNTLRSKYIYCGDGSWYYSDITTSGCRLIPDDKNGSALIADELTAHTALDILAEDDKYDIGIPTVSDITAEKGEPRLNNDISSVCGETVYCYIDDRTRRNFYFARSGDDFY